MKEISNKLGSIQLLPPVEQIMPAYEICHDNYLYGKLIDRRTSCTIGAINRQENGPGSQMILHPPRRQTPKADHACLTTKTGGESQLQAPQAYQELDLQVQDH
jgi:hypothetical protein